MSFPEFGNVVEAGTPLQEPGTFPEYGTLFEPPSRTRSLISAPVKGAVKEFADIAELFQKLPLPKGELQPERLRQFAKEKLPTQEKELESLLERGGRLTLGALLSPGGPAIKGAQVLGGAAIGHGLEKAGAPSWAQAIGESLPFFYAGGKRIPLKASQKNLGEFLRKQGLNENEIAPLLKDPSQIERWSKWAEKGKKSRELMESIYQKSGGIYDSIKNSASKIPNAILSSQAKQSLINEMTPIIENMPHKYRNLIKQDTLDLLKSNGHFNDLINFYQDINAVIGPEQGGRAIVGHFKDPIIKSLESISPELSQDFRLANDLYRTRARVAGNLLSKSDIDKLIDLGEIYGLGAGIFNRDLGLISKVIGAAGGRKLAREMLINPRLQNISTRIGEALSKNKLTVANQLMKQFKSELEKEDQELAATIP